MDGQERGARLCELVVHGCSARGLEGILGQSATTIHRHMATAGRPKMDRNPEERRAAAQEALNQRAAAERDRLQRQRVIEDDETGALSDEVATVILKFCRAEEGLPETQILQGDVPLLIRIAEINLSGFEARDGRPVRIPEDMDLTEIIRLTRPPDVEEGDLRMERLGKWIANVIWAEAPEHCIWERALWKATNRACELVPPQSPADRERARKAGLATLAD